MLEFKRDTLQPSAGKSTDEALLSEFSFHFHGCECLDTRSILRVLKYVWR